MPETASIQLDRNISVERLLAAARDTISAVPYCWVVTPAEGGAANARVVKAFPNAEGEEFWTRWFLTNRHGRKAGEISRAGRVTLAYQHASGDAYVATAGKAEVIDDPREVDCRLQLVDDPDGALAGKLVAVRVIIDHLELHVRGVTAPPWGHGRTLLDRAADGSWRLLQN